MQNSQSFLEEKLQTWFVWIHDHQDRFWGMVGIIAALAILIVFSFHRRAQENADAWTQLGVIHGQLLQGKYGEAKTSIEGWEKRFTTTQASGYERFLKADLLYKTSDYIQSAQVYENLSETAPTVDMTPLALSGAESALEMGGKLPEALASAQRFTERYPDHFLAAGAYLAQARIADIQGNVAAATAAYDRFLILFPQHPMAPVAKARRQALGITPHTP